MREPSFWWRKEGLTSGLLSPLAAVYGVVAAQRMARPAASPEFPWSASAISLWAAPVRHRPRSQWRGSWTPPDARPFVLSRGYGGNAHRSGGRSIRRGIAPPRSAMSRYCWPGSPPTMVARDRAAGADAARAAGAGSIVMDDGFQSPGLHKDRSILVVDGRRGIGNGRVFPAGPLRAPLGCQLRRAQALLMVGAERRATVSLRPRRRMACRCSMAGLSRMRRRSPCSRAGRCWRLQGLATRTNCSRRSATPDRRSGGAAIRRPSPLSPV